MCALIIKKNTHRSVHLCPANYEKWLNKKNKPRYISYSIRPIRK
jgi:hypothetical protein